MIIMYPYGYMIMFYFLSIYYISAITDDIMVNKKRKEVTYMDEMCVGVEDD